MFSYKMIVIGKKINVVAIKHFQNRVGDVTQSIPAFLSFETLMIPESPKMPWYHYKVKPYVPYCMQSFNLQGYGHVASASRFREKGLLRVLHVLQLVIKMATVQVQYAVIIAKNLMKFLQSRITGTH